MRHALLSLVLLAACGEDVAPIDPTPDAPTGEPVFYGQVQKILNDNCASCHSTDPARLAPFALISYEDAVAAATDFPMAYDVMNRVMPPFYADQDGDCNQFRDAHWLDATEMETLVAWINGGKLEGDPAASVAPPPPPGGLPQTDLVIDLGAPFTVPTATPDYFACFVVDAIGADKFVTGAHVKPSNLTVAHHVILFTLDATAEQEALTRQAEANGPYPCDGGPTRTGKSNFLVGWVPGNQATLFPPDTGIKVEGARKMVVQMHYNNANSDGLADDTTIALDLADSVAIPAQMVGISAPVNLAPHDTDAVAVGTLNLPNGLPNARIWGSAVHMHQRGTSAKLSIANQDRCVVDLVNWSFHWQHFYWLQEPVPVSGGDKIQLECHYDTSSDSTNVGFCESTECEMCVQYAFVTQ